VCCTRATGDRLCQVSSLCHTTCQSVRCVVHVLQVSVIVDKKAIMLHLLFDIDNPVVLAYHWEYGDIVAYQWSVDVL